jgi:putative DNA primase/helicase
MNLHDAIAEACVQVGIKPPKSVSYGKWLQTDTLSGRNGKGDGRIFVNDLSVTAFNWQTSEKATVWLKDAKTSIERKEISRKIEQSDREKEQAARRASQIANKLISGASLTTHSYLKRKGFPDERVLVVKAEMVAEIAGKYLVPEGARKAIVIPARIGQVVHSAQLIWEDGTKKFLAGGRIGSTRHRIATGADTTWFCEGLATGLSLRTAMKSLNRNDSILVCFSASNICLVARQWKYGRRFIAADNDKPLPQFGGLGAGEHYAKQADVPYLMPATIGDDINDVHQREGIFAVQRLISDFLRKLT